jgi:regulatory protein
VALAREYIARKRMKKPSAENAQKETARAMGRLMRAGFSAAAIYKVLREWDVEVDEVDLEDDLEESAG